MVVFRNICPSLAFRNSSYFSRGFEKYGVSKEQKMPNWEEMLRKRYPFASARSFHVFLQKFILAANARFYNNFSQNNQFHSYNTRNSRAGRLPCCRTNVKKFSVFFQGPQFFNSRDNEFINSTSISSFKKILKSELTMNK